MKHALKRLHEYCKKIFKAAFNPPLQTKEFLDLI